MAPAGAKAVEALKRALDSCAARGGAPRLIRALAAMAWLAMAARFGSSWLFASRSPFFSSLCLGSLAMAYLAWRAKRHATKALALGGGALALFFLGWMGASHLGWVAGWPISSSRRD